MTYYYKTFRHKYGILKPCLIYNHHHPAWAYQPFNLQLPPYIHKGHSTRPLCLNQYQALTLLCYPTHNPGSMSFHFANGYGSVTTSLAGSPKYGDVIN